MNIETAPLSKSMTYEEAILYCQFLEYNGHKDWRMPTKAEEYNVSNRSGWYLGDVFSQFNFTYPVAPVRDACSY